jgi:hypothetical protein
MLYCSRALPWIPPGIIPRFLADVFARLEAQSERRTFVCRASLMEIYNEDICDLLDSAPGTRGGRAKQASLQIREDHNGISVPGLKEVSGLGGRVAAVRVGGSCTHPPWRSCGTWSRQVEATSVEEVLGVLRAGSMNRTTASTLMNDTSSRSHAVFTITVESTPKDGTPWG